LFCSINIANLAINIRYSGIFFASEASLYVWPFGPLCGALLHMCHEASLLWLDEASLLGLSFAPKGWLKLRFFGGLLVLKRGPALG
jgi:hypothetical protein